MPTTSRIPTHKTHPPVGNEGSSSADGKRNIQVGGWRVETCKMPILNSKEIKQFGERLKVPLPEICFGNNYLSIKHPRSGFHYQWNTLDALLPLNPIEGEEQDYIKVAYADHWSQARKESESVTKVVNPFDWTYTTTYCGTNHSSEIQFSPPSDPRAQGGIPLAVLSRPDPILFFDEVTLFEDELHDNGMASLQVKVQLPPETPHDLTPLTDPNFVSQALQMLKTEEFNVASQATSSAADTPKKWRNMLGAHLDLASIGCPSPNQQTFPPIGAPGEVGLSKIPQ